MIDLKALRENPDHFRRGAARKRRQDVDIDSILRLDEERRSLATEADALRAEQKRLAKASGPKIGQLSGKLKAADGDDREAIQAEIDQLKAQPASLKEQIQSIEDRLQSIEPELRALLLRVPQPPADDVPDGASEADNIELRRWAPDGFDPAASFAEQRGFEPKTHEELCDALGLVSFERGVKLAGSRSYVLTGAGMRMHQAVLRFAMDYITNEKGFTPMSAPVLVREDAMMGTGFFPSGRDQTYWINETARGAGSDMYLTGTGEVALMGAFGDEIIDERDLPLKLATISTCFRREAGAAGRDTAGLYRIHQFDKVEQVVICKADDAESRRRQQEMIGIVEELLQRLGLPYRLIQCCTGDLGDKNADMIDIECWMPSRGDLDENNRPRGGWGETHSASRLYDFQCRRLNMRYRGDSTDGKTVFCHSLNNTVAASPRLLIPLLEVHQQPDGSVLVPEPLRPHMNGIKHIEPGNAAP